MIDFIRDFTKPAAQRRQERATAYVDGQLSARERTRFEAEMAEDAALREAVAAADRMRSAVRLLQTRQQPVPRNFTLDPARYPAPRPAYVERAYPALRTVTAFAALIFMFAFSFSLFNQTSGMDQMAFEAAPAAEIMAAPVEEGSAEDAAGFSLMAEAPVDTTAEAAANAADLLPPSAELAADQIPTEAPTPKDGETTEELYSELAAVEATPEADVARSVADPAEEPESFALQQSDTSSPDSIDTEVPPMIEPVMAQGRAPLRTTTLLAIVAGGLFVLLLIATLYAYSRRV